MKILVIPAHNNASLNIVQTLGRIYKVSIVGIKGYFNKAFFLNLNTNIISFQIGRMNLLRKFKPHSIAKLKEPQNHGLNSIKKSPFISTIYYKLFKMLSISFNISKFKGIARAQEE